ncbi:helix-turn-helix domain-containing protein [Martelella lutilitoris]|uniref:Helix-turn-helix domain-containing protein n=1 Tax=Martelella lutilitoris TaxID=2583532 RepID=A0A5C4JR18_9HYPH|nr:helix-turn-helix domain-containing protein [Martelella lutilitoris]TNB47778.1 helix-turn-helix domain-containing protein [Martelella lutilitoris]
MAKSAEATSPEQSESSLVRACRLLPIIAERNRTGVNLSTISRLADLHPATTRRLLQGLVEGGLLSFDPYSKLYHIGLNVFRMASTAGSPQQFEALRQQLRPAADEIAARTGDTVFVSVRVGSDSLCIDSVSGSFPIRTNTLDVGARRPLGVGAGAAALLAVLPEEERNAHIRLHEERFARYGNLTAVAVKSMVRGMDRGDYVFNKSLILPEVGGIAVIARDNDGTPVAAVSLATINSRLRGPRIEEVLSVMREAIGRLGFTTTRKKDVSDSTL